jgi:tetratricopeptide (TPR) repeat protein
MRVWGTATVRAMALACSSWALSACATTAVDSAKGDWHEVRTARFEVLTEGEPAEARALVQDLERFHQVMLAKTTAAEREGVPPLKIFVTQGSASFEALTHARHDTAGIFRSTVGGNYAVVEGVTEQDEAVRMTTRNILFHEYVHYMMAASGARVPSWYNEGFAEFMSTTHFRADGSYTVGCPPQHRTRWHDYLEWRPMRELLESDDIASLRGDRQDSYLQAWYAVHYLSTNDARKAQLSDYLQRFDSVSSELAVQASFGLDLDAFDRAIRAHASSKNFECVAITPTVPLRLPVIEERPISTELAHVRLGELVLSTLGPTDETLALLAQAVKVARDNPLARVHAVRGDLAAATDAGDGEPSSQVVDAAIAKVEALGSAVRGLPEADDLLGDLYLSRARRLQRANDPGHAAALKLARKAYRRAIRADETHAPAYYGLGRTYLVDDNGSKEPLVVLETAGYLVPSAVEVPLTLAAILIERGEHAAAEAPTRYVLRWAKNPRLRKAAQRYLDRLPLHTAMQHAADSNAAPQQPAAEPTGTDPSILAELEEITADTKSAAAPDCAAVVEPLPEQPSRRDLLGAIGAVQARVVACFEREGVHEVKMQLSGETGRVIAVSVEGSTAVQKCVGNALRALCVPRFSAASFSVGFPLSR